MKFKNISIKKEAYDYLQSIKSSSQSFSDAILSFKYSESEIMDYFGKFK